jgi:Zn-dependent protease
METVIQLIQRISLLAVPILLAVTLHEYAHGWMANKLGDPTARLSGRLSFNPFKHLDFFGTLVFILTQMIGWAKPVPVNPYNLNNPKKDMMLVSIAGPAANMILAALSGLLYRWIFPFGISTISSLPLEITLPLSLMVRYSVIINVGLAVFNIIPIPPLDGSKIVAGLLPIDLYEKFMKIERYGFLILLLLIVTNVVNVVIYPFIVFFVSLFLGRWM